MDSNTGSLEAFQAYLSSIEEYKKVLASAKEELQEQRVRQMKQEITITKIPVRDAIRSVEETRQLVNRLMDAIGSEAFGNSLTRYQAAQGLIREAVLAVEGASYGLSNGSFSLREVAGRAWARSMGIIAPPAEYSRSILTGPGQHALKVLLDSMIIVRNGHRYSLGDVEQALEELQGGGAK